MYSWRNILWYFSINFDSYFWKLFRRFMKLWEKYKFCNILKEFPELFLTESGQEYKFSGRVHLVNNFQKPEASHKKNSVEVIFRESLGIIMFRTIPKIILDGSRNSGFLEKKMSGDILGQFCKNLWKDSWR